MSLRLKVIDILISLYFFFQLWPTYYPSVRCWTATNSPNPTSIAGIESWRSSWSTREFYMSLWMRHLKNLQPMLLVPCEILIWSGSMIARLCIVWWGHLWTINLAVSSRMRSLRRSFKYWMSPSILLMMQRHKTSCAVFNTCIWEGASVTNHVLYMIEQIERLSKLSFLLQEQLSKDPTLNLLLKSYLPFLSYYRMMKPTLNYHNLLGLL